MAGNDSFDFYAIDTVPKNNSRINQIVINDAKIKERIFKTTEVWRERKRHISTGSQISQLLSFT